MELEEIRSSGIMINIEQILQTSGGNHYYEILVRTRCKERYKIVFDNVKDLRISFKSVYLDRLVKMQSNDHVKSSVVLIAHSKYLCHFEKESSGTIPIDRIKDYMITDDAGHLIEVLDLDYYGNSESPKLIKISSRE